MDATQHPGTSSSARRGPRVRKGRLVLLLVAGVVALLCLGGVGVAFVAYREVTEPDRSAPDVAVDNYLRAYLVDRNDVRAELFSCGDGAQLDEIKAFRADIEAREEQHTIEILVSWGRLDVQSAGQRTTVTAEIRRRISDGSESETNIWRFDVVDQGGWRVCTARRA